VVVLKGGGKSLQQCRQLRSERERGGLGFRDRGRKTNKRTKPKVNKMNGGKGYMIGIYKEDLQNKSAKGRRGGEETDSTIETREMKKRKKTKKRRVKEKRDLGESWILPCITQRKGKGGRRFGRRGIMRQRETRKNFMVMGGGGGEDGGRGSPV